MVTLTHFLEGNPLPPHRLLFLISYLKQLMTWPMRSHRFNTTFIYTLKLKIVITKMKLPSGLVLAVLTCPLEFKLPFCEQTGTFCTTVYIQAYVKIFVSAIFLTVRHILVECNNFARERKDIFGRRDVVESFRYDSTPH